MNTGTTMSNEIMQARPRSNTCPILHHSSTSSRKLKYGSKVIILGTDNVEQRVPQYVGAEAIIVDVPATWYKVQFADGGIVTFRPSALKLASECEVSNDGSTPSYHFVQPAKHSRARSNSGDVSKNILGNINPDYWPSSKVKILSGKFAGQTAIVKCSGNGWVQLDTPLGEVAKRATELELVEIAKQATIPMNKATGGLSITIPSSLSSSTTPTSTSTSTSNGRRRSHSESLVISPTSRNTIANSRLNEIYTSAADGGTPPHQNRNQNQNESQFYYNSKDNDSRTVFVDPKIRNLQTDYFRKYVEKEVAKVKKRPDLKYWNRQIQSTTIDEDHEREIARDVRDNYCHFCYVEKWPGSIVCWNELCSASPIFWKLPGAAGSPKVPQERYQQMERVYTQASAKRSNSFNLHDLESSKRLKSQRTEFVMTQQALEEERVACEILGSLSSLSPGECFPNIVTEYINTSPVLQITTNSPSPTTAAVAAPPSPVVSNSSSSSSSSSSSTAITSPVKNLSQKNERSDSGATDSEDIVRSDVQYPMTRQQPLILKFKGNSNHNYPPLVSVPETQPLHLVTDSTTKSKLDQCRPSEKVGVGPPASPQSPSHSQQQMKFKKPKGLYSQSHKGGMICGTPPSQEEFARFVNEHHFSLQKSSTQTPLQQQLLPQHQPQPQKHQENRTPPLSVLTARVDAQRGLESKPEDLFAGQDVAHGPPLLRPSHNSMDSIYPSK